jgi:drug/metabolite transporter (DMT)-like permease
MGDSSDGPGSRGASSLGLVLGLGVLYVVWGSTYLAIRFAVETIPPFLMAGSRFLLAGALLYLWARFRGAPRPLGVHWRIAVFVGALLMLGGNGGVVWAEKELVPSGLAALLVTTMPFWMAIFDWLRPHGVRPPLAVWAGLLVGFGGMIGLVLCGKGISGEPVRPLPIVALLIAPMTWALGSVWAKHTPRPTSPVMTTALHMLCGGSWLMLASALTGEFSAFRPDQISAKSAVGFVYLLCLGSLLTMTVYTWLLHITEPNLIATYAFVNPVIAVLLGWLIADEELTQSTLIAGAVIVVAVAWLVAVQWRYATRSGRARRLRREPTPEEISP